MNLNPRDILVQSTSGQLMNVLDTAGYYDPLQYPLLFHMVLMDGR